MAVLIPSSGPFAGNVYPIAETPYLLGRLSKCNLYAVFADDPRVSRQHARLVKTSDGFSVEDLNSVNGTLVNGHSISEPTRLLDGDRLTIGTAELQFFFELPTQSASHPEPIRSSLLDGDCVLDDDKPKILSSVVVPASLSDYGLSAQLNAEQKLLALIRLFSSLGRSLEVNAILDGLITGLFDVFPHADRGFVALLDSDSQQMVPHLVRDRHDDSTAKLRISRTILERVRQSREAILSIDAAADGRFEESASLSGTDIHSLMCVPLLDGFGEILGAIQLDSSQQRSFDQQDVDLFVSIAPYAGMSLKYAQVHVEELEKQTLQRDLELARRVQLNLLPDKPPQADGYRFYSYYKAAYQVGGDYYDYVQLPGECLAAVVADVSGKGISAALLMAKLSGELKYLLAHEPTAAAAVQRLNNSLCVADPTANFVTLLLAVFHLPSFCATFVNAGHWSALLRRSDGDVIETGSEFRGPALGVFPDVAYRKMDVTFAPGETLVLYTDGVTEAENASGTFYGLPRLRERVADGPDDAQGLGEHIIADVRQFAAGTPESDDTCLMCVRCTY